ncbi:hypothetical protein GKR48_14460 [Providencia sp. wls1943]|uniref:hypothetical protein n=1 Tax=Providencia sp. wls1943 TaxID=2675150 RepID=UPI0012B5B601|nr:hypothetical protein [Providencia sp. wls1943]MTB68008.1 hypothetical protein [Providencia sp. wls1943]
MDITTEKELAQALKGNIDTITVTGNLAKSTIKIKATGNVAWAIAIGAIGIAAFATYATVGTGGTAAPVSGLAAIGGSGAAVGILGTATTWSAISIAVAAGGVGVLNKLRKYKIVEKTGDRVVLKRK